MGRLSPRRPAFAWRWRAVTSTMTIAVLVAIGMAVPPGVASAATLYSIPPANIHPCFGQNCPVDHTITFDDGTVGPGQEITTQYEGQGVYFTDPLVNGFGSGSPVPGQNLVDPAACGSGLTLLAPGANLTASQPDAAEFGSCGGLEFPSHGTFAMFTSGVSSVGVSVGEVSASGAFYELDAYGQSHALLGSTVISANRAGFINSISYSAPAGQYIWAFALYTRSQIAVSDFGMDGLSYSVPPAQQPEISLTTSATRAGGIVPTAGSLDVTLNRFNGSTGEVDLAVGGLPSGVTATFSPSALTGTATRSTLNWSIGPSAYGGPDPFHPASSALTIEATPAVPAAGATAAAPLAIGFWVSLAFGWRSDLQPITLADCQSVSYYNGGVGIFEPPASMAGSGTLSVSGAGPGTGVASAALDPATFANGSAEPLLTMSTGPTTPAADTTLTLSANAPGYATQTTTLLVHRIVGQVTSWTVSDGGNGELLQAPYWGTSEQITVHGSGFCPGTKVAFGEYGSPPTISASSPALVAPDSISPDGTEMTVTVPHDAASGPLDIVSPGGSFSTATHFTVGYGYAASGGFNFANRAGPGIGLSNLADVFPQTEVYVQVDPCSGLTLGLVNCSVASTGIGTPQADFFLANGGSSIAEGGQCYGFSTSSVYLSGTPGVPIQQSPSNFDPGAGNVDQIADGAAIDGYILDNQITQGSTQVQNLDSSAQATAAGDTAAQFESQLRSDLVTQNGYVQPVIVNMFATVNGTFSGHSVVAYDVQNTGNGSFDIFVYNPNAPYNASVSGDSVSGTANWVASQQNSVIHVQANGSWSFPELGYTGSLRTGHIYLLPSFSLPTHFDLPGSFSFGNILASAPPSTRLVQVTDGSGHTLLLPGGALNRSASGIPGAGLIYTVTDLEPASAEALLPPGGSYTLTLLPNGGRTVAGGLIGRSVLASVSGSGGGGVTLSLDTRTDTVRFRTGPGAGAFTASIALTGGNGTDRTATLALSPGSSGTVTARLSPAGALSLSDVGGAAKVSVGLGLSGPTQLPVAFTSPLLPVHSGASITLHPSNWAKLGSTAVTLRTVGTDGRVTTARVRNTLATGRFTSLRLGVHSSPRRSSLSVDGSWSGASGANGTAVGHRLTTASVTWLVVRGTRVVALHSQILLLKHARLAVSWAVKGLRKGEYRAVASVVVATGQGVSGSSALQRSVTARLVVG